MNPLPEQFGFTTTFFGGPQNGLYGTPAVGPTWDTSADNRPCTASLALYCFEQ